jgi:cytochrome P450
VIDGGTADSSVQRGASAASPFDLRSLNEVQPILLALEIAILVLTAVVVGRLALKPPVLRDFVTYLPWSLGVAAVGVFAAGGAVIMTYRWPTLLHVFAGISFIGLLFTWMRARPTYGRRRRLPPGSLGVAASLDAIGQRDFYREQAGIHGPVFKMSQFGRPVVCVVGLETARQIMRTDTLEGARLPYNRFLPDGSLRYMDDRAHDREAPFFRDVFSGLDLAPHEELARVSCRRMLQDLATRSLESPDGIRPREHLRSWTFTVLASVFWGMAPDDERLPALDKAQEGLDIGRGGGPRWRKAMRGSLDTFNAVMRGQAHRWSSAGIDSGRGNALSSMLLGDPDALGDPSRAHNLTLVFRLALTDVTSLLDWIMAQLTANPDWQRRVRVSTGRSERPGEDSGNVAIRVVHETLRLEQSEYLYRTVAKPMSIGEFHVPAGWLLRVCVQESHRDPAIFPEPDRFDPDRFLGAPRSRREYSPFGVDDHGCMGVPIVHFLGRIFVEELCAGYHARLIRDAPPERGTRHRDHWRPGKSRRIQVLPVAATE